MKAQRSALQSNKQAYGVLTDEELFTLIQEGDGLAFDDLYARYASQLMAYCLKAMPTRELAEDVFQTVMTNVFAKREQFTGGVFAAWFFTIARNQCLKQHKKQRKVTSLEEAEQLVDEYDTTGSDFLLRKELHRAMQQLPEEFRAVIRLRYFFECSYNEISAELGISVALAKVRVFRGKNLLKKRLKKDLVETIS